MMAGNLRIGGAGSKQQLRMALRLAKRLKHLLVIGNQRGKVLRRGITDLALPSALHPFSLAPAPGKIGGNCVIANAFVKIGQIPCRATVRH